MQIQPSTPGVPEFPRRQPATAPSSGQQPPAGAANSQEELRDVFDRFVGQTFFQQLIGAMRKTVDKPAYFHGGRAEEVFQSQLDQVLSETMAEASAAEITDPMFELFNLGRH